MRGPAHVGQLDLADGADALLGHAVGGLPGRDAVALGDLEDAAQVVVDGAHHAHGAFAVVAVDFQRHVHHAAGIDGVVRRIQHAATGQLVADLVGGQLVVGRAADDLGLDAIDGIFVDGAAQRAGAVDIGVHVVDVVQAHGLAAQLVHAALHRVLVDVGDEHLGALFAQQLDELAADVAGALHGKAVLADILVAVLVLQGRHDALQGAEGGERRRVAGTAVDLMHAGDVFGLAVHVFHVVDVDADILGGDVAAVERVDVTAEGTEQCLGLVRRRVADDHRLAAAQVQAGHRVLVGHAARQAQHVVERLLLGLVGPHAQTAQGWAEDGVMDGDDGCQAGILVLAEHHFLVVGDSNGIEDHRKRTPWCDVSHAANAAPQQGWGGWREARSLVPRAGPCHVACGPAGDSGGSLVAVPPVVAPTTVMTTAVAFMATGMVTAPAAMIPALVAAMRRALPITDMEAPQPAAAFPARAHVAVADAVSMPATVHPYIATRAVVPVARNPDEPGTWCRYRLPQRGRWRNADADAQASGVGLRDAHAATQRQTQPCANRQFADDVHACSCACS